MKFAGEISVPADRSAVFEKLRDARFFASCIDGVRDLTEIDPTHYAAVLETKIAYLKFKFDIAVEMTEIVPPLRMTARAEGTPLGIVGRLSATSVADLRSQDGETVVAYDIDVALAGKLGSLGQPVLRAKAREMERRFVEKLRAAFAGAPAGAP